MWIIAPKNYASYAMIYTHNEHKCTCVLNILTMHVLIVQGTLYSAMEELQFAHLIRGFVSI